VHLEVRQHLRPRRRRRARYRRALQRQKVIHKINPIASSMESCCRFFLLNCCYL
jgi:hypothetical protein